LTAPFFQSEAARRIITMTDAIEQPITNAEEAPDVEDLSVTEPEVRTQIDIVEPIAGISAEQVASVRDLIARAYQDIVPELLTGDTLEALLASVPAARESYQRLEARFSQQPAQAEQVSQPLPTQTVAELNGMSTDDLLRKGMIERRDRAVSRPWPKTRL
jgi:hypothetical protein